MIDSRQRFRQPAPPKEDGPFDGILLVDKPAGPTSHDIVDSIRKTFGFKKVGHGGTLDPQATGLLIMLLGRGTKLSNHFLGSDKTYEGTLRLGIETDSFDLQGSVTREADFSSVTRDQLEEQATALTGDIYQIPPMVSAVKLDGIPLYKRARKGQTVERKPRLVHVYEFRIVDFRPPQATFVVTCTKGTYVRALCSDVGTALACGAALEQLRRTRSGKLTLVDALPLKDVLAMTTDELAKRVLPMGQFRSHGGVL